MIALRGLHPVVRQAAENAIAWARYYGIEPVVTSGYRSWAEQRRLYDEYRRGRSNFPANAPGDSAHQYGLAFDAWVPDDDRQDWDVIRRWVGFQTYPNRDWIHAEVPGWRQYK